MISTKVEQCVRKYLVISWKLKGTSSWTYHLKRRRPRCISVTKIKLMSLKFCEGQNPQSLFCVKVTSEVQLKVLGGFSSLSYNKWVSVKASPFSLCVSLDSVSLLSCGREAVRKGRHLVELSNSDYWSLIWTSAELWNAFLHWWTSVNLVPNAKKGFPQRQQWPKTVCMGLEKCDPLNQPLKLFKLMTTT